MSVLPDLDMNNYTLKAKGVTFNEYEEGSATVSMHYVLGNRNVPVVLFGFEADEIDGHYPEVVIRALALNDRIVLDEMNSVLEANGFIGKLTLKDLSVRAEYSLGVDEMVVNVYFVADVE